jgi:hypothetical protein
LIVVRETSFSSINRIIAYEQGGYVLQEFETRLPHNRKATVVEIGICPERGIIYTNESPSRLHKGLDQDASGSQVEHCTRRIGAYTDGAARQY